MATTYSITGNSSVYEGGRISLAVTSSLPRPTVMPTEPEPTINYIIPYTITGIDPARVGVGSKPLSGTLDFRNSFLIIDLSIVANQRTDGPTTVTVNIDNGAYTYDVQIIDSSRESNIPSLTAGKGNYDEGTSAIFTLTNGTPNSYGQYYLSGISSADTSHSGLYGNFSVGTVLIDSSGSGTITISLLNDGLTEGSETLAVRLTPYGLTSTIVINDTSNSLLVNPVQPVITQPISPATTTPIFSASNFISIPTGSLATNSTAANDLITGTTAIDTVVFKGSIKD